MVPQYYRENCITQRKVYQWVERFQSGRTSVDEDSLAHLIISLLVGSVEQVNTQVQGNIQLDIADKLDITWGSTYSIIHEDLGYYKIYAR
jgi:hypothetical protein